MAEPEILAVIPARSGSKSIPHKNLQEVSDKPLLAWSIEHALNSRKIRRVIVSTDSAEYAAVARQHGAETPFLRPTELAQDNTPDLPVFQHALAWLDENEGYQPLACVHLRPTCPVRDPTIIDQMIDILLEDETLDSVRTIARVVHPPFKMWYRRGDGTLAPVVGQVPGIAEPWNEPRQSLPATYIQTANIDVVRSSVITDHSSMTGDRVRGFLEEEFHDIDTLTELEQVRAKLAATPRQPRSSTADASATPLRTFCFDIDGIIATLTPENNYRLAGPRRDVVQLINQLYDAGHHIVLFTARGSATEIDWRDLTISQLSAWGVQYHVLRFGKPTADYYIDDRMLSLTDLEQLIARSQEFVA